MLSLEKDKKDNMHKSFKFILASIAIGFLSIGIFGTDAEAIVLEQDGVEVNMSLDKGIYEPTDNIKVSVSVTNKNPYSINNVSATSANPSEKHELISGQTSSSISVLGPNQNLNFEFIISPINGEKPPVVPDTGANMQTDGSSVEIFPYILVGGALTISGIFLFVVKSKRGKRKIVLGSIMLVFVLSGVKIISVSAAPVQFSFQVQEDARFSDDEILTFLTDVSFETSEVTITYDPGEGEGVPTTNIRPVGTVENLVHGFTLGFDRPGHSFIGWNSKPDMTGDFYNDTETVTLNSNLTLYAVWRPFS
jgi:hypothetical protein